jgi:hypothetical protein
MPVLLLATDRKRPVARESTREHRVLETFYSLIFQSQSTEPRQEQDKKNASTLEYLDVNWTARTRRKDMSTLEYLDAKGSVTSFALVPSVTLHNWLSELNGNPHVVDTLAKGVNRGKVLEEMEARRRGKESMVVGGVLRMMGKDRGYGRDWREVENEQGYTHLEELLNYQPNEWRQQVRPVFVSCEVQT